MSTNQDNLFIREDSCAGTPYKIGEMAKGPIKFFYLINQLDDVLEASN
jgi:hypothetical protein